MRSKLLSSFIFVIGFWWFVTTLAWSVADPETNLKSLQALARMAPFLHIHVPAAPVTVLSAFSMQKAVLLYWTLPILGAVSLFAIAGLAVVWFRAYHQLKDRESRESPTGVFRGVTVSLGPVPQPMPLRQDVMEIGPHNSGALETLTEKEKTLLLEVLGVLSAHGDSYAGEGHAVDLVSMAAMAVESALTHKSRPGLAAIVAAASELGKITAYKKDPEGGWLCTKDVCRESTTLLANLSSWWAMPKEDRMAIMFAVRYRDNPETLIDANGDKSLLSLARSLLYKAAAAVEKASTDERERVLSKQEVPDLAFKVLMDNLNQLGFQDGLPKGVKAIGWKIGGRIYLLEIKLRETLMAKLPEDVRGALAATAKKGLHPFTVDLMKALNAKGWLVKEINGVKVTAREALWNIQAGKLPYRGVLVLDIPDEYRDMLPAKDSIYPVAVTGPLFSNAGSAPMTATDMASMGLFSSGGSGDAQKKAAASNAGAGSGSGADASKKPSSPSASAGAASTKPLPPRTAPAPVPQDKSPAEDSPFG